MAKRKRAEEPTPLDLIRKAVVSGGYPHKIERQGDNTVLTIEVAPNVQTTAVFDPEGRPVPPPGVRELIERAMRMKVPELNAPKPEAPQEALESIHYDIDHYGRCTDEEPCQGLNVLMAASCVEHGGIVGMAEGPDSKRPDLLGFVPTPHHRKGALFAFNFCPCCGYDMRGSSFVLGAEGPTTLN